MARRKSRRAVARNGAALRAGADTAEIDVDDPHATRTGQKIRVLRSSAAILWRGYIATSRSMRRSTMPGAPTSATSRRRNAPSVRWI